MNLIAEYIQVALLIAIIGYIWKTTRDMRKEHREDCAEMRESMARGTIKSVVLETKLNIFLEHSGFSIPKVDRAIRDHFEELAQNDTPMVGCIRINELYKDKEG